MKGRIFPSGNAATHALEGARIRARVLMGALFVLPAAAVAVVGFAVLVVGAPRPYVAARLRGGPTEGVHALSWRLEVFERLDDRERPMSGRRVHVRARAGSKTLDWDGTTDERGAASVTLAAGGATLSGPATVIVSDRRGGLLLEGDARLGVDEWRGDATRRGGWLPGPRKGALEVFVAPGRGVFAVPFTDPLRVEVRRAGRRVAGATVTASIDGARVAPASVVSDADGRARFTVTPTEHAVSIVVRATKGLDEGRFDGALPVIPGALWVKSIAREAGSEATGTRSLRVVSPIARDVAYATLVTETERIAGAAVPLSSDGRGGAVGRWELPPIARTVEPLWAVVSSEPDQHSMALVGWPLSDGADTPSVTFDVPDQLLLDGAPEAFARDAARRQRARSLAALFAVSAMALAVILLALRTRGARRDLEHHLEKAGEGLFAPADVSGGDRQSTLWVLAALLCVALGFAAIALVSMLRT